MQTLVAAPRRLLRHVVALDATDCVKLTATVFSDLARGLPQLTSLDLSHCSRVHYSFAY
jgi:hypothetical protein